MVAETVELQIVVHDALFNCLVSTEESEDLQVVPIDIADTPSFPGIQLHPDRLEEMRDQVREWLSELPRAFRESGGCSLLDGMQREDGTVWADILLRVEELFILGMGLGMVKCQTPRERWEEGKLPF